jgi:hypothetical protein
MKAPPPREGGESFWLKGVSTKGWVDDKVVTLEGNFKVTGTKQYKTVLGAPRTVFLVEAETEAERKDRLRELAAQDQARKKAASERQAIRQEENKKRLEREKAEEQKKKTDAPKAEAARKLRFAKQYLREAIGQNDAKEADRLNELARKHLQEIVDNFAETPSATEAKKLLEKLK